nr:hypothetical protein BCU41_12695 [Vibrio lentus]
MSLGESAPPTPKLAVYTEDAECIHFVKAMLGRSIKDLDFSDISLGCGNYIQLASRKVPSFIFPNSIVVLDGDTRAKLKGKRLKNFICLPGELNPEGLLATFLHNLPESDNFWTLKNADYSKQYCFMDFSLEHILGDRKKAKLWYNRQLDTGNWGRGANVLYKAFLKTIPDEVDSFIEEFKKIYDSMTQSK